jgi:hypothetical protein
MSASAPTAYRFADMNLTAPPATIMTLATAIRAKRRSDLAPTSVVPGGNDASRELEKGTSDEKNNHTARRRNRVVGCGPRHRHRQQRPVRDER